MANEITKFVRTWGGRVWSLTNVAGLLFSCAACSAPPPDLGPNAVIMRDGLLVEQLAASGDRVWFASSLQANSVGYIGSVTAGLKVTLYPLPDGAVAGGVVAQDGHIWFTGQGDDTELLIHQVKDPRDKVHDFIGRFTIASKGISKIPIPTAGAFPGNIVRGANGSLFFAEQNANAIGEVRNDVIVEHRLPDGLIRDNSGPTAIAAGAGGVFFIVDRTHQLGELTGNGAWRFFRLPEGIIPSSITADLGRVWFADQKNRLIGWIKPAESRPHIVKVPWTNVMPFALTTLASGEVCFSTGAPFIGCYSRAAGFWKVEIPEGVGYTSHDVMTGEPVPGGPGQLLGSGNRLWYASQVSGGAWFYAFGFVMKPHGARN